ncbi:MAG: acyltransferase family protein [Niabella sp.]
MKQRYQSLDIFRGATVCLMILVNNPGSWQYIYSPLKHADWHGLTPTDLVFPFFLFAVGNAMAFVIPRLKEKGTAFFWRKIIKRTLIIFGIGLFLNWYPFVRITDGHFEWIHWVNPENPEKGVRIMGVLQRIALCYFFASIMVYFLKPKVAWLVSILMLLSYWVICIIGNPADPFSMEGWYGNIIDKAVLSIAHMYKGEGVPFEPEGLLSTIPAIVQVVFGYFVGLYIINNGGKLSQDNTENPAIYKMLTGLFVAGVGFLLIGYCWNLVFPVNKKIWSSSYVVVVNGLAIITIATMIYMVEVKRSKGFMSRFFEVFGKNPLFIFALSAFLPKTARLVTNADGVNPWNWLYKKVLVHTPGVPENGSLLYAICVIIFMWAICYWLDKKKIYIKV